MNFRTSALGIALALVVASPAVANADEWAADTAREGLETAQATTQPTSQPAGHTDAQPEAVASGTTRAVAILHPTEGNVVRGTVEFASVDGGVAITVSASGLTPGNHGFHIHEYGDCTAPNGTSAGGHFNPHASDHGGPQSAMRHVGDMGNLTADDGGEASLEYVDATISFEGDNSILGRGVIVHAGEDDLTSQPTGAAGARVACGVIGVANQ